MKHFLIIACVLALGCKSKEEILAAAEEQGKMVAEKNARLAKGFGDGLKDEGKTASEAVLHGAAQVVRGGVTGAVEGATELPITAGGALTESGIKVERAALHNEVASGDAKATSGVKVYLVFNKAYKGPLTLVARDSQDREAGRSKLDLDEAAGVGKFYYFPYEALTDVSTFNKLEIQ